VKSPMHILHIFSTFDVGGTETRTCNIINRIGSRFRHTLLIENKEACSALQLIDPTIDFSRNTLETIPANPVSKWRLFRKTLKAVSPDLVITYCWGTSDWVIANSMYRIAPHIHNEEGFFDETPEKQLFRRWIVRRVFFGKTNRLLVPSLFLKTLATESWKIPDKKVAHIPNGIDMEPYQIRSVTTTEPCILVIVAAIHPIKNHLRLLTAFKHLRARRNIRLWVVGDGPDRSSVEEFIHSNTLSDHIDLFGFQEHPETFLCKADIFCLTSDSEQMPMTVLEAMASGLPIMATDVGDIRHMVSLENKEFIVPCHENDLFEQKLETLILDSDIRKKIGIANRKKCENLFTSHMMVTKHAALYSTTAADR
jgi:L-malate glycosyltransferase